MTLRDLARAFLPLLAGLVLALVVLLVGCCKPVEPQPDFVPMKMCSRLIPGVNTGESFTAIFAGPSEGYDRCVKYGGSAFEILVPISQP